MNTLIIYSSQTGFTKKYANWIAEKLNAETMTIKTSIKKDIDYFKPYDTIIYGGWVAVEKIHKVDWFTSRIDSWKDKKWLFSALVQALQATRELISCLIRL
ncbi:MAG: flavodoxin domain-containing protein [Ruminococcus flavefaciens]|nr:flavodoxin domain-containing protein [Ruminococcus flavefaciens]